jgi:hypothetical protein
MRRSTVIRLSLQLVFPDKTRKRDNNTTEALLKGKDKYDLKTV